MGKIFISYRRDDAEEAAGRLSDHLVNQFGRDNIFMDVDGIDPGRDFRKVIDETLSQCDVLLGVMGKNWIDCRDESGRRRLEDPRDFVRLEIVSALKRDIPVIPVRVQGASLPKIDELPDELKDFGYRNAFELTHERWTSDVSLLTEKLRHYFSACDDPSGRITGRTSGVTSAAQNAPVAQPVAMPSAMPPPAITTPPPRKHKIRQYVRWSVVVLFALALMGSVKDDPTTAGFSFIIVVLFAWDPFKWFRDKS